VDEPTEQAKGERKQLAEIVERRTDEKGDVWNLGKDAVGKWRWTRQSKGNFEIVGASTESYDHRADCYQNAVRNGMPE
jgi:uncharacterized protein YegP (UPF0339 family)